MEQLSKMTAEQKAPRREAEEALGKSEEQYRLVFESNPHPMWVYDLETLAFLAVNHAALNHYGYSREEFFSMTIRDIRPLEDVPALLANIAQVSDGLDHAGVWRHLKKDETIIEVEITSHTLIYDGRRAELVLAMDVTDRRRVENALRKSEQQLALAIEGSGVGLWDWMVQTGEMIHNDRWAEIVGYTLQELTPASIGVWRTLCHPDDLQKSDELLRKHFAGETPYYVCEARMRHKDGHWVWVLDRGKITERDSQGRPVRMTGTHLDITEHKQAQDTLRQSEERFKYISQTISDFAYSCTNLPDAPFAIDWMTGAVERITGYSIDELKALGCWICLVLDEDRSIFVEKVLGLNPGESSVCELRIRRKDGGVRWLLAFTVSIIDSDDPSINRLYGGCQDITERKRAEEEQLLMERNLLQTQKLESLGVLAGGIAHDFNNLLMAILGYADLALLDLSPVSPARPKVLEIVTASRRAADLCRQMLAYSGKGKFLITQMHLAKVIPEMIHLFKTCISKKALLNLNLEPGLPPIEGDPSQIRQVLMNLVINASEAIDEKGGVITISTGARYCDRDYLRGTFLDDKLPEGLYLSLEVSDTGCGMDKETQARVFEPFFTTKFTGRGLGMAAVLGIVRGHRGAIKVHSEPGKGTTFRLLLPASQHGEERTAEETGPVGGWLGVGSVLLVDDDETVLAVGKNMLERLGFSVLTAKDGCEALEIYGKKSTEIVFVLLDLTMPRMNGEETFRELRRVDPHACVIMSSGYSEQEIASRLSGKGLAGFIQKPFELAGLREIMNRALKPSREPSRDHRND